MDEFHTLKISGSDNGAGELSDATMDHDDLLTHPVEGPTVWRAADYEGCEDDWAKVLTPAQVAELQSATATFEASGRPFKEMDKVDFPLPGLSQLLDEILHQLEGGPGFALLRGVPVEGWTEAECRIAYWGMGLHLGYPEAQDAKKRRLHDVRDTGMQFGENRTVRYFQTNQEIVFHNDGADMFALLCVRSARRGGETSVVSVATLFNEILSRRPDLAMVLQQDFHWDTRGQRLDGARVQVIPIYTWHGGHLSAMYKPYIRTAQDFPEVPRLTAAQIEAMELLEEVAREPGMALRFDLQLGDVLMANNYATFHARAEFKDDEDPAKRRHLMRLWLTIPNGRPLPPQYENSREFGETYARRILGTMG